MKMTRRNVLASVAATATLPCLAGCPSQRYYRTAVQRGTIYVPEQQLLPLEKRQDSLLVRVDGRAPLFVRKLEDGRYVALDARCTHAGCEVGSEPDGFSCPCHGSYFAVDGKAMNGPAQETLLSYAVEMAGRTLVIRVSR